jgi:hypothetical protein
MVKRSRHNHEGRQPGQHQSKKVTLDFVVHPPSSVYLSVANPFSRNKHTCLLGKLRNKNPVAN